MGKCKEIVLRVIPSNIANPFVAAHHYSGTFVRNSQLHFGAFLYGALHGVLSFGPSMDKRKVIGLVRDTPWDGFVELNRMAFDDILPRNSESYCIGRALREIKKQAPHIKWVISFADGCSCGDGTIYRASNFVLTGIKENATIYETPWGEHISEISLRVFWACPESANIARRLGVPVKRRTIQEWRALGLKPVAGFMLRYIYFLDPSFREKLTVPIIPFRDIDKFGAGMAKGAKVTREERHTECEAQKQKEEQKDTPPQ